MKRHDDDLAIIAFCHTYKLQSGRKGSSLVKRITQTTAGIASCERWDFWKDTALAAVDAKACGDRAAFFAHRTVSETVSGTLIETTSKPLSMERPQRKIARDGIDHACLVVAMAGTGVINQVNRPEDILRPGDLILYDLGRPYTAASIEPYRELRLYVPRDLFTMRVGRIDALSGLLLKGGSGLVDLFTNYLAAYATALPRMSAREADAGMDGVLHLLSGLVNTSLSVSRADGGALTRDTLLALAMRHIEVLLGDPRLDVAMLARTIGVSRSRLYDAFLVRGGVASAVRDARLERARLRLAAPEERHRTLEEIARLCGFLEYSTFTRAFRRRFGMSPNSARAQALDASLGEPLALSQQMSARVDRHPVV